MLINPILQIVVMSVDQDIIDMTSILRKILSTTSTEKLSVHYIASREHWDIRGFKYIGKEVFDELIVNDFSIEYCYVDNTECDIRLGVKY